MRTLIKISLVSAFAFVLFPFQGQSQLIINTTQTPAQLVQNVLLGTGVVATNITFTGSTSGTNRQIGQFTTGATATNLGLTSGIAISSGGVGNIPNAASQQLDVSYGTSGDADLTALIGSTSNDAAILQFDFQPLSNTVSFRYVFASEEYNDYVNSSFNDVFGFFSVWSWYYRSLLK